MSSLWKRRAVSLHLAVFLVGSVPSSATPSGKGEIHGLIVGRVYEIDRTTYREYRARLDAQKEKPDGRVKRLDPDEYLVDLPKTIVTARQLSTNHRFRSELSGADGEYMIRDSPAGTFAFTLLHDGTEYPVGQNLDLNVELSYVAELCFVVDREEKVAWMIAHGLRRDPEAPDFVPEGCRSALTACLAMLTGNERGFPEGLLLLLAGSGAAAGTLGIISIDQSEASPPVPR